MLRGTSGGLETLPDINRWGRRIETGHGGLNMREAVALSRPHQGRQAVYFVGSLDRARQAGSMLLP